MSPCPSRAVEKNDRTIRAVFHCCLLPSRDQGFTGSCLCYADCSVTHDQSAVKVHGVFPSRCGHPASSPEPQIRRVTRQDSRSIVTPFVQVGTYPTRNFARFISLRFRRSRTLSFPACIHARSQSSDLRNPLCVQVVSAGHLVEDRTEREKVDPPFGLQRMLLKERNDDFVQVLQPAYPKCHPLRVISSHHAAPKKFLESMKKLDVSLMLYDGKFGKHLILRGHFRVRINADKETSFAVYESNNPVCFELLWPGLNVKSLRVLHRWSLPCGLSPCPPDFDCPERG